MTHGLIEGGSLKLKDLSRFVPSKGQQKAHIAKVTRLMAEQDFDHLVMGKINWDLCKDHCGERATFAIDRTHWQYGKTDINYLVVSVVIGNISVPLVWKLVGSAGNSKTSLRKEAIKALLKIVPKERIGAILGDREFIGEDWFGSLMDEGVNFTMRLKNNTLVTLENGNRMTVSKALCLAKTGQTKTMKVKLWGYELWISGRRGKKQKNGEVDEIIVVSNHNNGRDALDLYKTRWAIERTFKCLKSEGFDFERTHITHPERLLKLFAMAALSVGISVVAGAFFALLKPIKIKNHGRSAWSLFTYGLDYLRFLFKKLPFFDALSLIFSIDPPPASQESH